MVEEELLSLLRTIGNVAWALASLSDDYQRQPNGAIPFLVLHHLDELGRLRGELVALETWAGLEPALVGENIVS